MLRALYVTFDGITDPLGQSQVLPYLEGLSKNGIKIYLISLEKDLKKTKELSGQVKKMGVTWYKGKYFKNSLISSILNIFQSIILSFYVVASKNIRIIHCRSYLPLFSALLLKKIFKIKIIFDMRGFWPEGLVDIGRIKRGSFYYKILKFIEKKGILLSDYVITLTPETKEIIENNYRDKKIKIVWMPTCVDEEKFEGKAPVYINNKFVMVYSGSLLNYYNVPAMVDFFIIIKEKIKNAYFLILANNGINDLELLFRKKGIGKDDYSIMSMGSKDVPKYLLGSDMAISFIHDLYFGKASFPTKLAEYLICGLPIVLNTQSSFIKELVNYNKIGVVLEKFDNDSYQKAVDKLFLLLADKDIKKRCIKIAEKYLNKKVCIDKYMDIYKELE